MSKAADMAKTSVKGSFHLMWGMFASTIISAIGYITLAWVLGASNYGLYAVVLTAPNFIGLFQDLGIGMAVTRYAAQFNSENQTAQIRSVFLSGFIFKTLLGLALSMACFLLSPFIATSLFNRPFIAPLIQIVSFTILAQALVNTVTAAFTGIETMHLNSVMLVSQSIIKTVLAPALVIVGLRLYGAIIGFTAASLITVLIGVLLVWTIYKNLPASTLNKKEIAKTIKSLLKFGLPISSANIIIGFLTQFYAFLLAIYVANNVLIGNYNVAQNFLVLVGFVATPINTMLYPAFSKINADKEPETFKNVFQSSVKYATLLIIPVMTMVMALATPAVSTIFRTNYSQAPLYITLLAANYIFVAFGDLSTVNIINSQEQAAIKLILTFAAVGTGVPLGLIAISKLGVMGLLITLIFDEAPSTIIGLIFVKKRYNVTIDWTASAKILLSSTIAGIISYLSVTEIAFSSIVQLILGVPIFLFSFVSLIALTKAVNKVDLANLREMTRVLGSIGKVVNAFLSVIQKMITVINL